VCVGLNQNNIVVDVNFSKYTLPFHYLTNARVSDTLQEVCLCFIRRFVYVGKSQNHKHSSSCCKNIGTNY